MGLYEVLKAAKIGAASDVLTTLRGQQAPFAKGGSTPTEHEYTGAVPYTFTADGTPLTDWYIKGNMSQTGTPTPSDPIYPTECGDLETTGTHAGLYKIPISSAGQTTPVYLGGVQTTRKIKKLVLTGEESFRVRTGEPSNIYYEPKTELNIDTVAGIGICSHYSYSQYGSFPDLQNGEFIITASNLGFRDTSKSSADEFKTYLAQQYANGTPVTVWYVLATEETGIVNEPLRKIGNYVDTLTAIQSGVSIPTNNGNTTIDVETAVKPSEVYIKYMG